MRTWGWKAESHCPALGEAQGSRGLENPPTMSLSLPPHTLGPFQPLLTNLWKNISHFPRMNISGQISYTHPLIAKAVT